jgi:translation initiation factor IF-1|tara:strand:- start:1011 stop:1454 length:444 start_codon:yes stop_codon:yes gene_type:complete
MVKNTHGGSKHKSQARKATNNVRNITIEPSHPSEKYAKVTKMFGNGMCQVELQDDKTSMCCHIRGKFRGKNKRHNTVAMNSIVVVGLREWESERKNCDLIGIIETPVGVLLEGTSENDEFVFSNEECMAVAPQVIPEMDENFNIDDI